MNNTQDGVGKMDMISRVRVAEARRCRAPRLASQQAGAPSRKHTYAILFADDTKHFFQRRQREFHFFKAVLEHRLHARACARERECLQTELRARR